MIFSKTRHKKHVKDVWTKNDFGRISMYPLILVVCWFFAVLRRTVHTLPHGNLDTEWVDSIEMTYIHTISSTLYDFFSTVMYFMRRICNYQNRTKTFCPARC